MRIGVLGVGLIGGSIGLAARRRLGAEVVGHDIDQVTLDAALERGAIDHAASAIAEACEGSEIVFCAAPVGVLGETAAAALDAAGGETIVTDAGSTKRQLVAELGGDARFIGGHPLAGAETAGVENAREELFEGARWYLTPTPASGGVLYNRLQRAIAGLGAKPQAIDAEVHDRMMATVSHLPHVIANVVAEGAVARLDGEGARLEEAGPSLRDATRVAGANPQIWTDIFSSNRESIADAVDSVIARLQRASGLIREGDTARLAEWQAGAAGARRALLESESAAGPVHELRLVVPNRPGIVAGLALALAEAQINIEDMALYPAQDNSTGAITLWVSGSEEAERAAALVREMGHSVSLTGAGD